MKRNNYWQIDGDNNTFDTLSDAMWHIMIAYTPKERIKYLKNTSIIHVVNGEAVSACELRVDDEGRVSKSKTTKL